MPIITVRNLSEEVHRALRVQAAQHGRSTEAEVRHILEASVLPSQRLLLGTALSDLGRRAGLANADVEALEQVKEGLPARPVAFE